MSDAKPRSGRPLTAEGAAALQCGIERKRIEERQEALLDQALMGTFPASDPVSMFRVD